MRLDDPLHDRQPKASPPPVCPSRLKSLEQSWELSGFDTATRIRYPDQHISIALLCPDGYPSTIRREALRVADQILEYFKESVVVGVDITHTLRDVDSHLEAGRRDDRFLSSDELRDR